jgi:hypothetical protein
MRTDRLGSRKPGLNPNVHRLKMDLQYFNKKKAGANINNAAPPNKPSVAGRRHRSAYFAVLVQCHIFPEARSWPLNCSSLVLYVLRCIPLFAGLSLLKKPVWPPVRSPKNAEPGTGFAR